MTNLQRMVDNSGTRAKIWFLFFPPRTTDEETRRFAPSERTIVKNTSRRREGEKYKKREREKRRKIEDMNLPPPRTGYLCLMRSVCVPPLRCAISVVHFELLSHLFSFISINEHDKMRIIKHCSHGGAFLLCAATPNAIYVFKSELPFSPSHFFSTQQTW